MKLISSRMTGFHKRLFPAIWFGFIAFFVVTALTRGVARDGRWMVLLMPCLMAALGFFLMKKIVWDLVDEVYDCGDSLLVRNRGEEERIPLANIMNVSASTHMNPPRITLRLVHPGRLGAEVTFSPQSKLLFIPFAKNPVAEDLIVRVDQARRRRAD